MSHLLRGLVGAFQPSLEVADANVMLNFRLLHLDGDDGAAGEWVHPFARTEEPESLRHRIIETLGGDVYGVFNALGIPADDLAAFDRQLFRDLSASLFVRQPNRDCISPT